MEQLTCALCGRPIDAGEAWMEADDGAARRVAHAGCVYRDAEGGAAAGWVPQESAAHAEG